MLFRFRFIAAFPLACFCALASAADPDAGQSVYAGPPYEVVNGWAVYDGDIVLGRADEVRQQLVIRSKPGPLSPTSVTTFYDVLQRRLWPDGIVPYTIDADLLPEIKETFLAAVRRWNEKTVITLKPRTNEESYLRVRPGICSASLGYSEYGPSYIFTENDQSHCSEDSFVHEIGHVLGLIHEHQRRDRDENRLVAGRSDFFGPRAYARRVFRSLLDFGPYDYRSVMSYAVETNDTIPPGIPLMGNRLSEGDIDGVARLYSKPPTETTIATNPPGLEVLVDGIAHTAPARFAWAPGTTHTLEVRTGIQTLPGEPNGRWLFGRWAEPADAPRLRTVTAKPGRTWYEANFIEQRQPMTEVSPPRSGTVRLEPLAPGNWYTIRAMVQAEARPVPGSNWRPFFLCCGSKGSQVHRRVIVVSPFSRWSAHFTTTPVFVLQADTSISAEVNVPDTSIRAEVNGMTTFLPRAFQAGHPRTLQVRIEETGSGFFDWGRSGRSQYHFQHWSDGSTDLEREIRMPAQGGSLTAHYTTEHSLWTEARSGLGEGVGGTVTPAGEAYYPQGTPVEITAAPDEGASFLRWLGDASGTEPSVSVRMDGPRAVHAWFSPVTQELEAGVPLRLPRHRPGEFDSEAPGLHFILGPSTLEARIELALSPGSAEADLYVLEARDGHAPQAYHRRLLLWIDSVSHRPSDFAEFRSETDSDLERIVISPTSDPPLHPEAVYFIVIVSDRPGDVRGELLLDIDEAPAPQPAGVAEPRALTFVGEHDSDPQPQLVTLTNEGQAPMLFQIRSDRPWLSARPAQGTVPAGSSLDLDVRVSGALPPDTHTGELRIERRSPGGGRPVELAVKAWFVKLPPER